MNRDEDTLFGDIMRVAMREPLPGEAEPQWQVIAGSTLLCESAFVDVANGFAAALATFMTGPRFRLEQVLAELQEAAQAYQRAGVEMPTASSGVKALVAVARDRPVGGSHVVATKHTGVSCYDKADEHEPLFVLRAQDPLAAEIVREWARRAAACGVSERKYTEAWQVAEAMDRWPVKKRPD